MNRDVVFVFGNPRTGSSALTRVLSLCGWTLPAAVFGADTYNPKGFWEPADAARLNLQFLIKHRNAPVPPADASFLSQIQGFLATCPAGCALLIKDPLINDLLEHWLEAARREDLSTKVVICVRHPAQSLSSLGRSTEEASLMWLKVNLDTERLTRGLPRVFVEYSNLLKSWRAEVARVSQALDIDVRPEEVAIDEFLTTDLHRHKTNELPQGLAAGPWLSAVHTILSRAARDGSVDVAALDSIFRAYLPEAPARGTLPDSEIDFLDSYFQQRPVWHAGRDF